ncbi:MAG: protein kinase [Myxococcales bacterium]|nr:protein kinase [Myxococcales bacterium]
MNELSIVPLRQHAGSTMDRIGSVELGCFRLKEILGRGSYGTSYLAEQEGFDRDAVVKIAHAELLRSRDADLIRRRFADELRAATRIEHPNLVTLFTAGETADGLPAIAMELAPGHPLEDLLAAHSRGLPPELVRPTFAQLGSALAALHGAGVVHRDLSPRNVMLDPGPPAKVKVLDFGVAKLSGRPRHTYGAVGTPRYMAPEQVIGRAVPASDVFAMGAMLWWALTGVEYRSDALTIEDLHAAALDPRRIADPRDLVPELPGEVAQLVGRMLSHDEHQRPTAEAFCTRWRRVSMQLRPRPVSRPRPVAAPQGPRPSSIASVSAPPSFGSLPESSATPSSAPGTTGPRALVVDANPVTQHLLAGNLRRSGCRVKGTRDPRDATRSSSDAFDLVVISTEIPDADALDVARYLEEYHPNQWVVLSGPGDRDEVMARTGARDLIGVPGDFGRLDELVDLLRGELALRESSRPQGPNAIDVDVLANLRASDPTVVQEVIEMFVGETPEALARIGEAHLRREGKAIFDLCRTLSTSSRALGASHLARLAHAAAELVREGDLDCIPGFVAEMEREYGLVFQALMQLHTASHRGP